MSLKRHLRIFAVTAAALLIFWLPMAGVDQFAERVLRLSVSPFWPVPITLILMIVSCFLYLRMLARESSRPFTDFLIDLAAYLALTALYIFILIAVVKVIAHQGNAYMFNGIEYYIYCLTFFIPPCVCLVGSGVISITKLIRKKREKQ